MFLESPYRVGMAFDFKTKNDLLVDIVDNVKSADCLEGLPESCLCKKHRASSSKRQPV